MYLLLCIDKDGNITVIDNCPSKKQVSTMFNKIILDNLKAIPREHIDAIKTDGLAYIYDKVNNTLTFYECKNIGIIRNYYDRTKEKHYFLQNYNMKKPYEEITYDDVVREYWGTL